MIEESLQEEACLFVLGLLSETDSQTFHAEMARNRELRNFVAGANNATLALARSAPPQELSPEVKQRLLATLRLPAISSAVVAFPKRSWRAVVPWSIAACLLGIIAWQGSSHQTAKSRLQAEVKQRQVEVQTSQEKLTSEEQQFLGVKNQLEKQLGAAQSEKTILLAQLAELNQKDSLAQSQIEVLDSLLKDRPQAVAVSVWDSKAQTGQLLVENLPVLEAGRDYQLWIIDPEIVAPVSAGIFKVDAQGKVRLSFKPGQTVKTAAKFAVTEEKEGGVVSPTMNSMVVISGG